MALVALAAAVAAARSGLAVAFATDTVPALAIMGDWRSRLYELKRRSPHKPLILMAARMTDMAPYVVLSDLPHRVMASHWPGAVTVILPATALGRSLNPGQDTLGVRIPAHGGAIHLLQQTGPLLTTSANRSGEDPLLDPGAIARQFPEVWVWDDPLGQRGSGQPSTVVAWTGTGWQLLRQGQVQWQET
ncbi:MAG: L-threonylcarbamoyladenylate synthase [Oscillatoriales cyanobacterium SM2_2_1]|nr:L-threonylcarbamoyladenylate synthase [Oscillatoriales cyanobacterium SM2_2_1]